MKPVKNRPRKPKPSKTTARPSSQTSPLEGRLLPAVLNLERLLVPVDFSEFSRQALRYAAPLAEQFRAELILLYVVEPRIYSFDYLIVPPEMEDVNIEAKRRAGQQLEEWRQQVVSGSSLRVRSLVRTGRPFQEICSAAEQLEAGMIVMATHGYTGLKHLYLGSTAERVLRHAPCPVLALRSRESKRKGKK